MSTRGPVARSLIWLGLLFGAFLALAGSVVLNGSRLVPVLVAAGLVACVAFGAPVGGGARRAFDAAWKAFAATVGVIMMVAGVVVLAGGTMAVLVCGVAGALGGAVWLLRAWRARHAGARTLGAAPGRGDDGPAPILTAVRSDRPDLPVSLLPTAVLGSEWLRTTAELAYRLQPAEREAIIRRRQETLDELERRDPVGFARWLAAGADADSDPSSYVGDGRTTGTDAA
jgi:hypothetical protein